MLRTSCNVKRSFNLVEELLRISTRKLSTSPKEQAAQIRNATGKSNKPQSWDEAKLFSEIPGERSILKSIRNFLPGGKFYNVSLKRVHQLINEEFGNLVKIKGILGRPDMLIAFDPNDFEQVYRNEGPWPHRRDFETFSYFRRHVRPDVYGDNAGLLVEQGEKWKELRGKVNPVMMQPRVVKQYISAVEEVAEEFITRLLLLRDSNKELPSNFDHELTKWSLESISRIALDAKLGCLQDDKNSDSDAQKMIRSVHDIIEMVFKLEVLPSIWKYVKTPAYNKLIHALDTMTNVSLKKIDEAIDRINNDPNKHSEHEASVLEKLLKIDRKVAVVMAMDMLLAGVDTTSYATAILLYFLASNQRVQDKLREEILTILPKKNSKLTTESFNHIPYLRACMKEANRILPITGGTMRKLPVDLVLSGYQVPKGLCISRLQIEVALSLLSTPINYQFPKSDEYIPERWSGNQNTTGCPSAKSAHPFANMPFGFGPRSCIGKRFADLEIEALVTKIIRNHKIEWNYGKLKIASKLLTRPMSPLKFKVSEL